MYMIEDEAPEVSAVLVPANNPPPSLLPPDTGRQIL